MEELRLVGVHEDGEHLLLSTPDGRRFRLPLTDQLVQAARMPRRPKVGERSVEIPEDVRPRDIQAMVRAGMTAAEVAERSGWQLDKVRRFEAPVLAERDHVAALARATRLRPRGGSGGGPTLAARVLERLTQRGVETDDVVWDSWRSHEGHWAVVLTFAAGGRQRQATWAFDPSTSQVHPADDEARWLSEDERSGLTGPLPTTPAESVDPAVGDVATRAPGRAPAPTPTSESVIGVPGDTVYDIEADEREGRRHGSVDLMAAVRERTGVRARGRAGRRRADAPVQAPAPAGEPELPLENLPAAVTAPVPTFVPDPEPPVEVTETAEVASRGPVADEDPAPQDAPEDAPEGAPGAARERAPDPLEESPHGIPDAPAEPIPTAATDATTAEAEAADPDVKEAIGARRRRRTGRASVPSWDDIMFGAKREEESHPRGAGPGPSRDEQA